MFVSKSQSSVRDGGCICLCCHLHNYNKHLTSLTHLSSLQMSIYPNQCQDIHNLMIVYFLSSLSWTYHTLYCTNTTKQWTSRLWHRLMNQFECCRSRVPPWASRVRSRPCLAMWSLEAADRVARWTHLLPPLSRMALHHKGWRPPGKHVLGSAHRELGCTIQCVKHSVFSTKKPCGYLLDFMKPTTWTKRIWVWFLLLLLLIPKKPCFRPVAETQLQGCSDNHSPLLLCKMLLVLVLKHAVSGCCRVSFQKSVWLLFCCYLCWSVRGICLIFVFTHTIRL